MILQIHEPQHSNQKLCIETLKELRNENQQIADKFLSRGYYLYEEIKRVKEIQQTLRAGGIL